MAAGLNLTLIYNRAMAKKIIIGNWKMNPESLEKAKRMFKSIKTRARGKRVTAVIAAPYVYLESLSKMAGSNLHVAAQDSFSESIGPYTGEVSPMMLKKMGVNYVILNHSERRSLGETNKSTNLKIKKALEYRMHPIVCIGESERDEGGEYLKFIRSEIEECFARVPKNLFKNVIIAYEPIWAISTTKGKRHKETPEDFRELSIYIRKVLSRMFDNQTAMTATIIYGGSSNSRNAEGFLTSGGAAGLLPGAASLEPEEYGKMLAIADSIK